MTEIAKSAESVSQVVPARRRYSPGSSRFHAAHERMRALFSASSSGLLDVGADLHSSPAGKLRWSDDEEGFAMRKNDSGESSADNDRFTLRSWHEWESRTANVGSSCV